MKPQRLPLDMISSLPQPIIETILCFLPIKDAVRTSIFSRKWRYNWTKIPKLDFCEYMFEASTDVNELSIMEQMFDVPSQRKNMTKRCKLFNAIYQVLLLHQGPINEFSLFMFADGSCVELDHIILHLSRNHTLKKLSLFLCYAFNYRLPLSIFLLHLLTDLYLQGCNLEHQPTFTGFDNLTSLYLENVNVEKETLLHLLSGCPLLKQFTLDIDDVSLLGDDECTIIELFDHLPMIEHLTTCHWVIQSFAQDRVPQVLPSTLLHLKYFSLSGFCLVKEYLLPFVGLVIRSSANLEKLKLEMLLRPSLEEFEMDSVTLEAYSDIWLEHLNVLEIEGFLSLKHELEFVKLILAKSPVLKKVNIFLDSAVTKNEEMLLLRILLRSPRASHLVTIIVEHRVY